MLIEQFAEARLDEGTFTLADLVQLAADNGVSLSEVRTELEGYGFQQNPKFTGPMSNHEIPIKRGQMVTIHKGTVIRNRLKGGDYVAGRTYQVKVDHVLTGCRFYGRSGEEILQPPSIRWAGTGGYWSEVSINDIPEAFQ